MRLTDAQIYALRRMASGTAYNMRGDCKRGEEKRAVVRGVYPVNAPSIPVLFRLGLVRFVGDEKRERSRWYRVELTPDGKAAAATAQLMGVKSEKQ